MSLILSELKAAHSSRAATGELSNKDQRVVFLTAARIDPADNGNRSSMLSHFSGSKATSI
jgi:hypothetical protein